MPEIGEATIPYPEDIRAAAIEQCKNEGLAATARATGVDKSTLTRWLVVAGIDPAEVAKAQLERMSSSNQAAQAAIAARRNALAERVLEIAELAAEKEIEMLQGKRKVAGQIIETGKGQQFIPENETVRLSEIVGSRTRAIHDLEKLTADKRGTEGHRPSSEQVSTWREELAQRRELAEREEFEALGE